MDSMVSFPSTSRTPYSTRSGSIISEMNDDFFQEVFQHLRVEDLAMVADVNIRFRQNAIERFKRSKRTNILVGSGSKYFENDPSLSLLYIAKVLRHFGALVSNISMFGRNNNQRSKSLELLSKYCCGTPSELSLHDFNISDEVALQLRPALGSVQQLKVDDCEWGEIFLRMLPSWSPDLRRCFCVIKKKLQFDGLYQEFPRLMRILFDHS